MTRHLSAMTLIKVGIFAITQEDFWKLRFAFFAKIWNANICINRLNKGNYKN